MNLTTIFTGHTLDLREIVAIGPPMSNETAFHLKLQLDIHLHSTDRITVTFYSVPLTAVVLEEVNGKLAELEKLRAELVLQWEKAGFEAIQLPVEIEDEPQVDYQRSEVQHNDRISPIITEFWNS